MRISPEGVQLLDAIAAADENCDRSDLIRLAVGEWLGRRAQDCKRNRDHQGPIKSGACGHCGREVP